MKKIFLVCLIFSLLSCEKDDICDENTATTSKVVIEFYDFLNQENLKNVNQLIIKEVNQTVAFDTIDGVSTVSLPLRTSDDITKYSLVLNSDDDDLTNEDLIEFNYTRNQVYVSRACGYKTVFNLNDVNGIVHTDSATNDLKWIKIIAIEDLIIENENETHIKIYF